MERLGVDNKIDWGTSSTALSEVLSFGDTSSLLSVQHQQERQTEVLDKTNSYLKSISHINTLLYAKIKVFRFFFTFNPYLIICELTRGTRINPQVPCVV